MKGVIVASVAWDLNNTDRINSGNILVGSTDGAIFEAQLDQSEKGTVKLWRPAYNTDTHQSIDGLALERVTNTRLYIVAVTSNRLYEFHGGPTIADVFAAFDTATGRIPTFIELPGSAVGRAAVHISRTPEKVPRYIGWMLDVGVYHGRLVFGDAASAIVGGTLIKHAQRRRSPLAMTMTDLHCMLVYPDQLRAVRLLDQEVVAEEPVAPKLGQLQGLCTDHKTGVVWVYSDSALFVLGIVNEERDMCALLLERGHYDMAKQYAKVRMSANQAKRGDFFLTTFFFFFSDSRREGFDQLKTSGHVFQDGQLRAGSRVLRAYQPPLRGDHAQVHRLRVARRAPHLFGEQARCTVHARQCTKDHDRHVAGGDLPQSVEPIIRDGGQ